MLRRMQKLRTLQFAHSKQFSTTVMLAHTSQSITFQTKNICELIALLSFQNFYLTIFLNIPFVHIHKNIFDEMRTLKIT